MTEPVRIAVVGAGLMGHGIAQVFAAAGHDVIVHDQDAEVLAGVRRRVEANLRELGADPAPAERLSPQADLATAVTRADWVFEAAPERLELKQRLFAAMDAAAPAGAVLATNTSVLRVGEIAQRAQRRGRIVGTHWWNPPHMIPLVEVVQAQDTEAETVRRTIALLESVGKVPVHVRRDVAGFVGNRLQHALWREAIDLVDAGVCDAQTVDTVVKQGFGRRLGVLGPIENADLIGLDLTLAIHEYVLPRLNPPSPPARGLRERVAAGRLGMKTEGGYRDWTADAADAVRTRVVRALAGGGRDARTWEAR